MPNFEIRKTSELTLPSYPDSKIVLYDRILAGGMEKIMSAKTDFERGLFSLIELIKDWNFVDDKGGKMQVSLENLRKLPLKDLTFLMDKVRVFFTQEEKEGRKSSKK